jgi:hypothetical protein
VIGTHTVTVTPVGGGAPVDVTCLLDSASVTHGRDDTGGQPAASTASLDLSAYTPEDAIPAALEIGATVRILTATASVTSPRFVGRVTDIEYEWDDAGDDTPNRVTARIQAASALADVGRRIVGDAPFPQELDGARVSRVMALAGVVLDPAYSDPGTVQILPRDIDTQPALDVSQEAAKSGWGVVWQTRAGEIRYADSAHRRGAPVALTLDACDIFVTPKWRRTTEGLINKISLGYGVTPEGGEQPRYVAQSDASIARYGRYEVSDTTVLVAAADATALGQMILTRNSSPVWIMDSLPVDVKGLSDADTTALLGLDMHSLVNLTGLPSAGAAPTSALLWVEGLTETATWGGHEITLLVSGYCRTVPVPRWDEVDPAETWDVARGTWDDWTCMGPLPTFGRWADVPASDRWNGVPASVTWDTWPY